MSKENMGQDTRPGHRIFSEEPHIFIDALAESIKKTGKVVAYPNGVLTTGEFPLKENLILEEQRSKHLLPEKNIFLPEDYEPELYGMSADDHLLRSADFSSLSEILGYDYADDNEALDSIQIMETFFNEYELQVEKKKDEEFIEMIRDPGFNEMPELSDEEKTKLDYLIDKSFDNPKPRTPNYIKINMIKEGLPKITPDISGVLGTSFQENNIPKGDTMDERNKDGIVMPDKEPINPSNEGKKKPWYKRTGTWLAGATIAAAAIGYSMCGNGPAPTPATPTPTPTATAQQYTPTPTPTATKTPAPETKEAASTSRTAQLYMSGGMGLWDAANKLEIEEARIVPFVEYHQEKFGLRGDTLRVTQNADGTGTWENCDDGLKDFITEGTYEFDLDFDGKKKVPHYTGMTNTAKTPTPCIEDIVEAASTPTPAPVVTPKPKVSVVIPEAPKTEYVAIPEPEAPETWIQERKVEGDIALVDCTEEVPPPPSVYKHIEAPKTTYVIIKEAAPQEPVVLEREVEKKIEYKVPDIKHDIPEGPLGGWNFGVKIGVGDMNIERTFANGAEVDEAYGTNFSQLEFGFTDHNTRFENLLAFTHGEAELGTNYSWLPEPTPEIDAKAFKTEVEQKFLSAGKSGPFLSGIIGAQYSQAEHKVDWGFGAESIYHEQDNAEVAAMLGLGIGRFDDSYVRLKAGVVGQTITDETCGFCGIDSDSAIEVTPVAGIDAQKVFKNKEGKASFVARGGFSLGLNEQLWTNDEHEMVDGWHGQAYLDLAKVFNFKNGNSLEVGVALKGFGDYSQFDPKYHAIENMNNMIDVTTHGKSGAIYLDWRF